MSCSITERVSSTPATIQSVSATSGGNIGPSSLSIIESSSSSTHQVRCRERVGPEGNSLSTLATSPSPRQPAEGASTPSGDDGPPQNGPQSTSPQGSQFRSKPCGTMLLCCCCKCPWSNTGNKENGRTKGSTIDDSPGKGVQEEVRVSAEELRSWGKSFDKLMKSAAGRKVFRNFLRGEYSEENILFWLACDDFKKHTDKAYTERRSRLIYMNYIHPDSSTEVSLDSRVREIVKKQLQEPQPNMYDEAQLQIYTLMQRDSYPRFLNSPAFKDLMQQAEKKGKEKLSIFLPPQKTPSLHTIDLNSMQIMGEEHGHASQSTPLLTAVHPAATMPVSDFSDRDQDAC
ncbi:regulator of G-protein signaling 17 [Euwallacea similis]|uniref:regulator of G-protein signaling 17 n=1 Tax=Euwallacea similis TaxID=1736056 RepID=UPI00344E4C40